MIAWLKGRIACWRGNHQRGKRVGTPQPGHVRRNGATVTLQRYQCPRCEAEWTRTVKPKAAA